MRFNTDRPTMYNSLKLSLNLQILTWEKDSHGLFDYEATKHRK